MDARHNFADVVAGVMIDTWESRRITHVQQCVQSTEVNNPDLLLHRYNALHNDLSYFDRLLNCAPYLKNKKGTGARNKAQNPRILVAHPTPSPS